jgi:hypothetical protein
VKPLTPEAFTFKLDRPNMSAAERARHLQVDDAWSDQRHSREAGFDLRRSRGASQEIHRGGRIEDCDHGWDVDGLVSAIISSTETSRGARPPCARRFSSSHSAMVGLARSSRNRSVKYWVIDWPRARERRARPRCKSSGRLRSWMVAMNPAFHQLKLIDKLKRG